ncbi:MAG: NAD-dependent deacylase [Rhodobiaceae bacterium]|nr:NAD-dependent deacylase [Rhodobiaceae bacterium]
MTKIVILTGAGISAESGLGTFRDEGGIWSQYDLEDVATPEGYARDPELVHRFYNDRRSNCLDAAPNAAHEALARLEAEWPGEVVLVTQNIDDLHERAGSRRVIHMHGELLRALCAQCGFRWDAAREMSPQTACPACGRPAARPDVVWFGEMPYRMDEIDGHLSTAALFVSIGTSGTVYPAAGFVMDARVAGARTLELTLDRSEVATLFEESRLGPATQLVPHFVAEVLGGGLIG